MLGVAVSRECGSRPDASACATIAMSKTSAGYIIDDNLIIPTSRVRND